MRLPPGPFFLVEQLTLQLSIERSPASILALSAFCQSPLLYSVSLLLVVRPYDRTMSLVNITYKTANATPSATRDLWVSWRKQPTLHVFFVNTHICWEMVRPKKHINIHMVWGYEPCWPHSRLWSFAGFSLQVFSIQSSASPLGMKSVTSCNVDLQVQMIAYWDSWTPHDKRMHSETIIYWINKADCSICKTESKCHTFYEWLSLQFHPWRHLCLTQHLKAAQFQESHCLVESYYFA